MLGVFVAMCIIAVFLAVPVALLIVFWFMPWLAKRQAEQRYRGK